MSDAQHASASIVAGEGEVLREARRLRWFLASFRRQIEMLTQQTGVAFALEERRLASVFVDWLHRFEAQRENADLDRRDFTHFAGGLMLRELIRHAPLKAERVPAGADRTNPAFYWPEGYAYVAYCLNVCEAVLEQEFHQHLDPFPDAEDITFWWSFRENTRQDPRWAIAFFDKFSGREPNWNAPEVFFARHPVRIRLHERSKTVAIVPRREPAE